MKIHNVRLGHATNSSSSHSIISVNPGMVVKDDWGDNYFGWEDFILSSKELKDAYVASTIWHSFEYSTGMPDNLSTLILKGLGFSDEIINRFEQGDPPGIDHQSRYDLPIDFGTKYPSMEFAREFREYVTAPDKIILGGNDNDEGGLNDYDYGMPVDFNVQNGDRPWRPETPGLICRKDDDWWTLFDPQTGNRVVLSFKDDPAPYAPKTPQLVDLKISNFCTVGCSYCFMGSTKQGEHLDSSMVYYLTHRLADAKVFEVAIGGGEPTECPSFVKLLTEFLDSGISVNFTTKKTDWIEDQNRADVIIPLIGAFAYSVDKDTPLSLLDTLVTIFKYRKYDLSKMTLQVIPAVMTEYQLGVFLTWARTNRVRVTLLGFKEIGRGNAYISKIANRPGTPIKKVKDLESYWINIIQELEKEGKLPSLAIDTTLAARYQDDLLKLEVPNWLFHIEEGKYSMFIDAVTGQVGPSSYHTEHLMDWPNHQSIQEAFANITPV